MMLAADDNGLLAAAARQLNASLDGWLLLEGEPGYSQAQPLVEPINSVFNDRKPALIVRAASAGDAAAAVRLAAERRLPLCVRAGGHDSTGACLCEGGVLVDVSPMKVRTFGTVGRCYWWGAGPACQWCTHPCPQLTPRIAHN